MHPPENLQRRLACTQYLCSASQQCMHAGVAHNMAPEARPDDGQQPGGSALCVPCPTPPRPAHRSFRLRG